MICRLSVWLRGGSGSPQTHVRQDCVRSVADWLVGDGLQSRAKRLGTQSLSQSLTCRKYEEGTHRSTAQMQEFRRCERLSCRREVFGNDMGGRGCLRLNRACSQRGLPHDLALSPFWASGSSDWRPFHVSFDLRVSAMFRSPLDPSGSKHVSHSSKLMRPHLRPSASLNASSFPSFVATLKHWRCLHLRCVPRNLAPSATTCFLLPISTVWHPCASLLTVETSTVSNHDLGRPEMILDPESCPAPKTDAKLTP